MFWRKKHIPRLFFLRLCSVDCKFWADGEVIQDREWFRCQLLLPRYPQVRQAGVNILCPENEAPPPQLCMAWLPAAEAWLQVCYPRLAAYLLASHCWQCRRWHTGCTLQAKGGTGACRASWTHELSKLNSDKTGTNNPCSSKTHLEGTKTKKNVTKNIKRFGHFFFTDLRPTE